ncbi:Transposon Tf2-9 poly [Paramuricea clavata]|uniref:Transposon Tf2-9 poly n=1 Tax=Paramuricea clavata TaxID=317549 RepID=A0A7D9DMH1_PARCT|nr:Transposon Tf2-9 poly [Paramuricea clavata]
MVRSHKVDAAKKCMSSCIKVHNFKDGEEGVPIDGSYRDVNDILDYLFEIPEFCEQLQNMESPVLRLRFAGDGGRTSRNKNTVVLLFNIIDEENTASFQYNYPIAIYNGDEKYDFLKKSLQPIMDSMQRLQENGYTATSGPLTAQKLKVEWFLCADWKFLALLLGINPGKITTTGGYVANNKYFCLWCDYDKSVIQEISIQFWKCSRTIGECIERYTSAKNRNAKKGVADLPLLDFIDFDHMIPDTLHLFLRVTDVLFDELVRVVLEKGAKDALVEEMAKIKPSLDFCFSKDDKGKDTWPSYDGPHKKHILEQLDIEAVLTDVLSDAEVGLIVSCWARFEKLDNHLRSKNCDGMTPASFQIEAMAFANEFMAIFKDRAITPHIPTLAVERVNYISKQVFFKKLNKKDYCNGLVQFFNRLLYPRKHKLIRKKRPYVRSGKFTKAKLEERHANALPRSVLAQKAREAKLNKRAARVQNEDVQLVLKRYIIFGDKFILMLNPNEEEANTEEISMATTLDLKPPPPFDAEGDNSSLAQRWKEWRERFNMHTVAANIKDDAKKRAVLLYVAGSSPQKNVIYERYVKQTHPTPGESVDSYITRLRTLAETCEFEGAENEIRDQFVMTCSSHGFRTKLLRETDLTLAKLITMARAKELAVKQASNISGHNNSRNNFNRVKDEGNDEAKDKVRHAKYVPKPHKQNQCRNCGNEFKQGHKDVCPAKGKTCRACGKLSHFARVCRSRKNPPKDSKKDSRESVRVAQQQTQKQSPPNSSDDEYTFAVSSSKITNIQIQISGNPIAVTIDSGATTNILDSEAFACIRKRNKHVQLEPTQTNIYAYNAVQPLSLLGKCRLAVESNGKRTISTFYVVNGKTGSLLVTPIAQRPRRVPFHLRKQVSDKLEELQSLDIIEPAEGPTSWVSPIVAAPKPHNSDEIRLCGDYRRPNQALLRERHPIPTVDELMEEMSGAVVFSKLDHKAGYHQIVLEENSRNITTFCTHKGLFRKRSKVYTGYEISQTINDKNLEALLQRLVVKKLTLNLEKCKFNQPSLWFYGYILSKDGLSADPKKVEAIKNFKTPADVSQLRSFLGLANYCSRFIKDFSTLTAPLRELTTKSSKWSWSTMHEKAFTKVKNAIASDCTMAFYDPNRPTKLTVDASPVGLGAVLAQTQENGQDRCIAYASCSLRHVEARYSQTEKEALAAVWGCERFHLYLVGTQFDLITDHKPLEVIYSPKSKPPLKFNIKYRPGSSNPADVLSRQPLFTNYKSSTIAEKYVNFIQSHSVPKSLTLDEIRIATLNDPELQRVTSAVKEDRWNKTDSCLSPYRNQHEQLTVSECGVILRNSQIVIPKSFRSRVLSIAHEGHQGIVKTKMLVRSKVWWPGIDKQVQQMVKECVPCQAAVHQSPKCKPPLNMTKLPPHPWHTLNADFCGPFPNGEKLLVVIDAYSRYPEVEVMQSTTTTVVISKLQRIFAGHGYPEEVITDNGPPFNAVEFTEYLAAHGVHHRRITPYWPQANGEAERFMKTVTKAIRTAHSEGKRWQSELDLFLLNYRSTPHSTTHISPAELLFNRSIRNKLPSFSSLQHNDGPMEHHVVRDKEEKEKMKVHADRRNNAKESQLKVGDYVLMQVPKDNKLSMPFNPKPFKVIEIKGNMVTARNTEPTVTRNVSCFKCLTNYKNASEEDQNDEEDDFDDDIVENQQPTIVEEQQQNLPDLQRRYCLRQNRRPPDFYRS